MCHRSYFFQLYFKNDGLDFKTSWERFNASHSFLNLARRKGDQYHPDHFVVEFSLFYVLAV